MNSIHLIGRLTKAPRFTITSTDKARVNFTLAIDGVNGPDYVPVTCFGKLAENVAEYTDKGHLVAVEARITSGRYTSDKGDTVFTLDVIAQSIRYLSRPKAATATTDSADPADDPQAA